MCFCQVECGIRGRLGAGGGNGAIGLSRLTPQLPCRHPFASPPATQSRLVLARFYCFWQLLIFFQLILLVDTLGPTWSSIHFLNGPGSLAIGGIATIFRKWQKNIFEKAEKKISGVRVTLPVIASIVLTPQSNQSGPQVMSNPIFFIKSLISQ